MNLSSLIKIFLIIIPGVIFARKNIIDEKQCQGISSVVVNFIWPCLILDSLQMAFSTELLTNAGILVAAFAGTLVLAYVISMILCKVLRTGPEITYLIIFMLIFGNTGFMGIPVCKALYGEEGVFYAALMDSLSDVFIFTVGTVLIKKTAGVTIKNNPKEIITSGLISSVIGICLFMADIRLPEVISECLATIGSATTPLAMFIIGYKLGRIGLRGMIGDRNAYVVSIVKLLLIPVIVLGIIYMLIPEMTVLMKVIAIQSAMPAATCTVILAEQYRGNTEFASKGVLLSTLLSVITLPVFAMILG